ncbi:MAG: patatin-like phospholipase family protein [Chloroflexota bacterium]
MRPKIALVLGGGGSRGIAHIGVLDVLVKENIPIDFIVGTSMGAIVGGLFAFGLSPGTIAHNLGEMRGTNIFSMNIFSARARQRDIQRKLARVLGGKTFADLRIPLFTMAVDMHTGEELTLHEGPIIPAILASSAVPAVFPPVEVNGRLLSDGGVIDSLATHVAFDNGADVIIAVDVYPPLESDDPWIDPVSAIMGLELPFTLFANTEWSKIPSMASSMWRASRVMTWYLHQSRLKAYPPDVLLVPEVAEFASLDFKDIDTLIESGRIAAEQQIDQIRALTISK